MDILASRLVAKFGIARISAFTDRIDIATGNYSSLRVAEKAEIIRKGVLWNHLIGRNIL